MFIDIVGYVKCVCVGVCVNDGGDVIIEVRGCSCLYTLWCLECGLQEVYCIYVCVCGC